MTTKMKHRIVYDAVLKRPGCALLQAAMGGTVSAIQFPSESWLLAPTPNMRVYEVTDEQMAVLVSFAENNK